MVCLAYVRYGEGRFPWFGRSWSKRGGRVVAGQSTNRGRIGYAIKGWAEGGIALGYLFWFMASRPMAAKGAKPGAKQKEEKLVG